MIVFHVALVADPDENRYSKFFVNGEIQGLPNIPSAKLKSLLLSCSLHDFTIRFQTRLRKLRILRNSFKKRGFQTLKSNTLLSFPGILPHGN